MHSPIPPRSNAPDRKSPRRGRGKKFWLRLVSGLAVAAAIGWALTHREAFDPSLVQDWIRGWGTSAPLVFIGLYTVATVLFLPGSVATLAGGALFGPYWGTLFNLVGATLGAIAAFLIARYLAANWVHRWAGQRLQTLLRGVAEEGWRFVAFVRLVPLFPFNLLNYALGLTQLPLMVYAVTTFLAMAPGATAYTYLGYVGRETLVDGDDLIRKGLLALGLLAIMAYLPRLVRRFWHSPQRFEEGKHD